MRHQVHLIDRSALTEADDLIARFGDDARLEAASRARQSRTVGNLVHFCRWRQVERTIEMLSTKRPTGTVH